MLYLKIFLISIPLVLVISMFSQKLRKNKVFRGLWLVCVAFSVFFMLLFGIILFGLLILFSGSGSDYDLVNLSKGLEYKGTRFEYRYGSSERTVYDPYDKFRAIYGNKPDEIYVDNGTRVVVYNEKGAIIKSKNDSIDVVNDKVHTKGWMGIWTEGTRFKADKDGVIHETQN